MKNEPLLLLAIVAIILFVGFFVVYPVVRVITFPSLQDYAQLFGKARWFKAVKNSLYMTLISTLSCTAVAFLFAYVIARLDVPCKGLFRFVTLLPIVSPPFIVALSYSTPPTTWGLPGGRYSGMCSSPSAAPASPEAPSLLPSTS